MTIKGSGWSHYIKTGPQLVGGAHNRQPDRQSLKLGSDVPFFKDGRLNRDPHATPSGPAVIPNESEYKRVDVFHHRADKD